MYLTLHMMLKRFIIGVVEEVGSAVSFTLRLTFNAFRTDIKHYP